MAGSITHSFVSAKADSSDTTLVSSSEWNEGHTLSGGVDRQVITYLGSETPSHIKFVDGPLLQTVTHTFSGGEANGVTFASIVVVNTTEVIAQFVINIDGLISSLGASTPVSITLRTNAVGTKTWNFTADVTNDRIIVWFIPLVTSASRTFDLQYSAAGGTINQGVVKMDILTIGR